MAGYSHGDRKTGRTNNPSRALKYPLDKHLYAQRHLVEAASQGSSSSDASQPASKKRHEIIAPSSLSQPSSYGCGNPDWREKCRQQPWVAQHFSGTAACL
jgi:hypothetical protein